MALAGDTYRPINWRQPPSQATLAKFEGAKVADWPLQTRLGPFLDPKQLANVLSCHSEFSSAVLSLVPFPHSAALRVLRALRVLWHPGLQNWCAVAGEAG